MLSKLLWTVHVQWSGTTLQYSPFAVDVCYIPVFDPTWYDWLYYWFHGGCVVTSGEVYSSRAPIHTGVFPSIRVVMIVKKISRLCHEFGLMIIDSRMTDGYFRPCTFIYVSKHTSETTNEVNQWHIYCTEVVQNEINGMYIIINYIVTFVHVVNVLYTASLKNYNNIWTKYSFS